MLPLTELTLERNDSTALKNIHSDLWKHESYFCRVMMSVHEVSESHDYTPSILKRVQLDDTAIRVACDEPLIEVNQSPHSLRPSFPCHCHVSNNCRYCMPERVFKHHIVLPDSIPLFAGPKRERPKLVSISEFQKSLVEMARDIVTVQPKKVAKDRLNADPLIDAFRRSLEDCSSVGQGNVVNVSSVPIGCPDSAVHSGDQVHAAHSVDQVPTVHSVDQVSVVHSGDQVPPVEQVHAVHSANLVPVSFVCADFLPVTQERPIRQTVKLLRILEKISARRIVRFYKRHYARRTHFCRKSTLQAAIGALTNSRHIRSELHAIFAKTAGLTNAATSAFTHVDAPKNAFTHVEAPNKAFTHVDAPKNAFDGQNERAHGESFQPASRHTDAPIGDFFQHGSGYTDAAPSQFGSGHSDAQQGSKNTQFSQRGSPQCAPIEAYSVRIILSSNVQSPAAMDALLASINVFVCVAQPALHPRAFVLATAEKLPFGPLIEAVDVNFPIRVFSESDLRTHMFSLVPKWHTL